MKIAYLSSYQPRKCGLATFNDNLIKAVNFHIPFEHYGSFVVALNDSDNRSQYHYSDDVRYVIRQENNADYEDAAEFINQSGADLCCIQHEFGIYGGESGMYLLAFTRSLKIPFVVIFHTVLESPDAAKHMIVKMLAQQAARVIVMSKKAVQLLKEVYAIAPSKLQVIPHGVPDFPRPNRTQLRKKFQLQGKRMLLTFGLISPNKGLETVIRALPDLCRLHPNLVYLILGKTHPHIERQHGLAYLTGLRQLAQQLGVDQHVRFISDFVSEKELHEYLTACDLYITPYLHKEQITSGTLSYAVGAGAAVVSTPYWHAQELLEGGRGRFFEFNNDKQLHQIIDELLTRPQARHALQANAHHYGLSLRWPVVGGAYAELFRACRVKPALQPEEQDVIVHTLGFPKFNTAHLIRLTDDTGIFQHCRYGIPNRKEGYCLDDNARALMTVLTAIKGIEKREADRLMAIYLAYMQYMQLPDGNFHNFLSYSRQYLDAAGSEDAFGRTIWALGQLLSCTGANPAFKALAYELFSNATPHFQQLTHLRGIANTLIGISYYAFVHPDDLRMVDEIRRLADLLKSAYYSASSEDWRWFEDKLTYDNGIIPLALLYAYEIVSDDELEYIALDATGFLRDTTMANGYLTPVGNQGWYNKGGHLPAYDQQAIDTAATVLLFAKAYQTTRQISYRNDMITAFNWFLGTNSVGAPLYDPETGGCYDGLSTAGPNLNQGAESTLAYLMAHATVANVLQVQEAEGSVFADAVVKLDNREFSSHLRSTVRKGVRFTG
ncbi:glycosyltransferase family 4 protein [Parapedobacter lycopersici]|uniref:glycosyltransferase family 4 protein n=1 Tax=Parapedobacter lycopersici TaxID=1864939 RepID=UPI0033429CE1